MEKLTLFELHFDDAQIGPTTLDSATDELSADDEEPTVVESRSGGSRVLRLIAASIVLSVVATVIARRFNSDDAALEFDEDDVEDISLETVDA